MDWYILEHTYFTSYHIWIDGQGYSNPEEINAYLTGLSNIMYIQLIMISILGSLLSQL